MNFDDIRKNLDKIIAQRLKLHEDELFGQLQQASMFAAQQEGRARGFNMGPGDVKKAYDEYMREDDVKTITLTKDDYRVVEEEEG